MLRYEAHECALPEGIANGSIWQCDCGRYWESLGPWGWPYKAPWRWMTHWEPLSRGRAERKLRKCEAKKHAISYSPERRGLSENE